MAVSPNYYTTTILSFPHDKNLFATGDTVLCDGTLAKHIAMHMVPRTLYLNALETE